MSQEAYTKFEPELKEDGILLIDEDLVKPNPPRGKIKMYAIPATRFAEEIGRRLVLNIVMLGFFTAVTGLIDAEAMRKSVLSSIPKGTEELNKAAFEKGYSHGLKVLGKKPATASKGKK
jgi:2-oxoglutarate ferredoxin oxidoreductase subunit gamma